MAWRRLDGGGGWFFFQCREFDDIVYSTDEIFDFIDAAQSAVCRG